MLVGDPGDLTPTLEKMYRAMGQELPHARRILELNPDHALVKGLNRAYNEREDRTGLAETAELLHGLAVLAEGGRPRSPAASSGRWPTVSRPRSDPPGGHVSRRGGPGG